MTPSTPLRRRFANRVVAVYVSPPGDSRKHVTYVSEAVASALFAAGDLDLIEVAGRYEYVRARDARRFADEGVSRDSREGASR